MAVAGLAVACAGRDTVEEGARGGSSEPAPATPCADPDLPTTVAYREVPGVAPDLTSVDVHTGPERCGAPVVLWVHGGGYRTGDKANRMADKVALAQAQGWVLVSVNYRLTDPADPTSARYPDHFDDVAAAVAWTREHIAGYGGDPDRLAILGHSAGADIVSNVVVNPAYLAAHGLPVDALRCAGPLDTEGFDKVAAGAAEPDGQQDQWQVSLGDAPDYLTSTSATYLVRPDAGIPPTIGVVRGPPRRVAIAQGFLDALESAGVPTVAIDASSLSHDEVSTRIGAPGDDVMTPPLVAFLDDCFAGQAGTARAS